MGESAESESRVSRRSALKRIGAAGAIVWVTPVISSLSTPAYAGSPPPGGGTCCTCNCSGADGRVVLQSCNPGLNLSGCESVCQDFCIEQQLFPETVAWSDCGGTGNPSCGGPTAQGAEGTACSCCGVSGQSCTTAAECCSGICNAGVCA